MKNATTLVWFRGPRYIARALAICAALACGSGSPHDAPTSPPPDKPVAEVPDGPFTPGQSYFGRKQYIEYIAGNAPVIFTAPHGGTLTPSEIPERSCGTTVRDLNTELLARRISAAFFARTGKYPHVIINRLARSRLDANRDVDEASCGNAAATVAWEEWHSFIEIAKSASIAASGRGWLEDLHGHGHDVQRLELGYLLTNAELDLPDSLLEGLEASSSVRQLSLDDSATTFAQLLRGPASLGALFAAEGYPAIPSPADPMSLGADYFDGGYNARRHGCVESGEICAVQIEANRIGVRDSDENVERFAEAVVTVTLKFLKDRWGSLRPPLLHFHYRPRHRRHLHLLATPHHPPVRPTHGDGPPGAHHVRPRDESFPQRRRQEVHLELDRQHLEAGLHERQRRVPARAVENGGDDSGMQKAVLLGQPFIEGKLDLDTTRFHAREPGTDRLHHALTFKADAHAALEFTV